MCKCGHDCSASSVCSMCAMQAIKDSLWWVSSHGTQDTYDLAKTIKVEAEWLYRTLFPPPTVAELEAAYGTPFTPSLSAQEVMA